MSKRRKTLLLIGAFFAILGSYLWLVFLRDFPIYEATHTESRLSLRDISRDGNYVLDEMSLEVFKASGLWITKVVFADNGSAYAFTPTSTVFELDGLEFPYWALIDRHQYSGSLDHFTFPRSSKPRPSDDKP